MIDISKFAKKEYSQHGEDGILECIFKHLNISQGWFCEFGAWDGVHLSNVRKLMDEQWKGVLIEGNPSKVKELQWNTKDFPEVYCHEGFVSLEPGERLNTILSQYPIPAEFDFLSIDIDSHDYWIWASLTYSPKVVCIEYNSNWKHSVTIPYDRNGPEFNYTQYFGASAKALILLGQRKGYDCIGHHAHGNLFFVKSGLNQGLFRTVLPGSTDLISINHHAEITAEEKERLIYNPPFRWEDLTQKD